MKFGKTESYGGNALGVRFKPSLQVSDLLNCIVIVPLAISTCDSGFRETILCLGKLNAELSLFRIQLADLFGLFVGFLL